MTAPSTAETRIAVLGTGTMGAPIARNLLRAGFAVTVWNRTAERAAPLVADGAQLAEDPGEAVVGRDVVLTMLPDGDTTAAVMPWDRLTRGSTWIQMATVGLAWTQRLARGAEERGISYVDAPVSGSDGPAAAGDLLVLAAALDQGARTRVQPVFDAIGRATLWLRAPGDATTLKLALNAGMAAQVETLAETIALADGLGIEPQALVDAITGGPLGSPYAAQKEGAMLERDFTPGFALRLALKDVRLAPDAAKEAGIALPVSEAVAGRLAAAAANGHADEDLAAVVQSAGGRHEPAHA